MHRAAAAAIVAAVLLASSAAAQRTVRGKVVDSASSQPLNGVIVEMAGLDRRHVTRTDEAGEFVLTDVAPGAYRASIRRIGYAVVATEIIVESGMRPVEIRMRALPQVLRGVRVRGEGTGIYGLIGTSQELKPIENAQVYVAGSRDSVFTDSAGAYYLALKKPGTFMVRVRAPGFIDEMFVVEVKRNQVADGSRLLEVGEARPIPPILWKDFDQRLSWSTLNKSALMTGAEVRRAGGSLSTALKASGSMVARGMKLGPTVCVFINGQPRPSYPIDAIRPEEITALEVYSGNSDPAILLFQDWPKNARCTETYERVAYGATLIRYLVIWTR